MPDQNVLWAIHGYAILDGAGNYPPWVDEVLMGAGMNPHGLPALISLDSDCGMPYPSMSSSSSSSSVPTTATLHGMVRPDNWLPMTMIAYYDD